MTRPRILLMPTVCEVEWKIKPQLEEWAEVASFDAPGIGADRPGSEGQLPMTAAGIVERGLGEADARGWRSFVLVGDEVGAAQAIRLAARRPGAIEGLVLGHPARSLSAKGPRAPLNGDVVSAVVQVARTDFRSYVRALLADVAGGRTDLRIIDCGCGVGQNMRLLEPHGHVVGFELEPHAAAAGREFGRPIACADITRIPFPDDVFDLAVSFDVLQVIEPDVAAVREIARIVRPGGRVLLTVAAFEMLSGDHAEVWSECRRYTPRTARALAESAGLRVERVSFAFATLFPLMLAARAVQRLTRPFRSAPTHTDMDVPWAPLNAALMRILDGEVALSRYLPMPIGTSLIVIARKGPQT